MSFFEKHKIKIIFAAIMVVSLALTFWLEGRTPEKHTEDTQVTSTVKPKKQKQKKVKVTSEPTVEPTAEAEEENTPASEETEDSAEYFTEQSDIGEEINDATESKPAAAEQASNTDDKMTCTIAVRCDTILDNMQLLKKGKESLIPSDGIILPNQTVNFYEGENAFNVLSRELKRAKIPMDATNTPAFNSVYINAINNIYEFDCGDLSGWQYKVNGNILSYSCSQYILRDGDVIEWLYTCDMGEDLK